MQGTSRGPAEAAVVPQRISRKGAPCAGISEMCLFSFEFLFLKGTCCLENGLKWCKSEGRQIVT